MVFDPGRKLERLRRAEISATTQRWLEGWEAEGWAETHRRVAAEGLEHAPHFERLRSALNPYEGFERGNVHR